MYIYAPYFPHSKEHEQCQLITFNPYKDTFGNQML